MGCGGSRLDHGTVLPPQLRPLFLLRLEEFRKRRTLRNSLMLLKDGGEGGKPREDPKKMEEESSDEEGRMIGHGGSPRSPSFRVYFQDVDDREDEHLGKIKKSALESTASSDDDDDTVASKECSDEKKKAGRERNMKNLRNVLSKGRRQGGVRNLLAVKSTSRSAPHRHLSKAKAS